MEIDALVNTLVETLTEVEAETLADKLVDRLAEVEGETLADTLGDEAFVLSTSVGFKSFSCFS